LKCAGSSSDAVFTKSALKLFVKHGKGSPREINILCDNALIAGYAYQKKTVDANIIKELISDFEGKKRGYPLKWKVATAAVFILLMSILIAAPHSGFLFSRGNNSDTTGNTLNSSAVTEVMEKPANPPDSIDMMAGNKQASLPAKQDVPTTGLESLNTTNNPVELNITQAGTRTVTQTDGNFPVTRVLKEGDYLTKLCVEIYGFTNDRLVEWMKEQNPHIKDVDVIDVGEKLFFPKLGEDIKEL